MTQENVRVVIDKRNEKIGYKIREHSLAKIPIILAIGEQEVTNRTVSVRRLGEKNTITMSLDDLIKQLKIEVKAPDQV